MEREKYVATHTSYNIVDTKKKLFQKEVQKN